MFGWFDLIRPLTLQIVAADVSESSRANTLPSSHPSKITNPPGTEDVAQVVIEQIRHVRRNVTGMSNARAILVIESNLDQKADDIESYVKRFIENVCGVTERVLDRKAGGERLVKGSRTSRQNKNSMMEILESQLKRKTIYFHAEFRETYHRAMEDKMIHIKSLMRTHLSSMNIHYKEDVNNPYVTPVVTYSGKDNGMNDDFVMVFGILFYVYYELRKERTRHFVA